MSFGLFDQDSDGEAIPRCEPLFDHRIYHRDSGISCVLCSRGAADSSGFRAAGSFKYHHVTILLRFFLKSLHKIEILMQIYGVLLPNYGTSTGFR